MTVNTAVKNKITKIIKCSLFSFNEIITPNKNTIINNNIISHYTCSEKYRNHQEGILSSIAFA